MSESRCYICRKEIAVGLTIINLIMMKSSKTFFRALIEFFRAKEQFVCEECLSKGIEIQKILKLKKVN